ncbi:EF-hand domain-containing protein [Desulfobacula phenolica]|uniref:EF-hand domain-containing protein n=1 Tax=Desulfobacula phenolica TaxID=90732 RepID=A0A1H2IPR1_9BACT|nr:hypothetical protein [Desulfobacula phenolica]SDU46119.1 hypothetical protein SAMN04487931_10972 [Desulfobacula phenolica]
MINSVSSMNNYMPTMRMNQTGQGPGPVDRFQSSDTDASGGISTSELESLASSVEETTGKTIDTETAMESYDLDGDNQLSGEELFSLVSDYGLQPSPSGAGQGGGGPSKGGGKMMPPPPPTQSSSLFEEETSISETNTIEDLYDQMLEKVTSAYGYSDEIEFLMNQTA